MSKMIGFWTTWILDILEVANCYFYTLPKDFILFWMLFILFLSFLYVFGTYARKSIKNLSKSIKPCQKNIKSLDKV